MGQISLPVINKSGINSYWNTSGDSKYENSIFFSKDYYLRKLISHLVKRNIELRRYVPNEIKDMWFCNIIKIDEVHKDYYMKPSSRKFKLHILSTKYLSFYDDFISTSYLNISNTLDKVLPCYICKLLLLKHNDVLVIVNRYIQIKRGSWKDRTMLRLRFDRSPLSKGIGNKYSPTKFLNSYEYNSTF